MNLHIHFNEPPNQTCALDAELEVGKTATVHFHNAPDECEICPNGHCHAPNLTISRIGDETIFVSFEGSPVFTCEIEDLPPRSSPEH